MKTIADLSLIIKALSDPNRLKILSLLNKKSLCVCEIKALLSLAQPTISTHLKILVNAKLIKAEKQGTWVIYHLIANKLPEVLPQIVANSLDFLNTSSEVKELLQKQKALKNIRPKCN